MKSDRVLSPKATSRAQNINMIAINLSSAMVNSRAVVTNKFLFSLSFMVYGVGDCLYC